MLSGQWISLAISARLFKIFLMGNFYLFAAAAAAVWIRQLFSRFPAYMYDTQRRRLERSHLFDWFAFSIAAAAAALLPLNGRDEKKRKCWRF